LEPPRLVWPVSPDPGVAHRRVATLWSKGIGLDLMRLASGADRLAARFHSSRLGLLPVHSRASARSLPGNGPAASVPEVVPDGGRRKGRGGVDVAGAHPFDRAGGRGGSSR
jgi:hypothetical protein